MLERLRYFLRIANDKLMNSQVVIDGLREALAERERDCHECEVQLAEVRVELARLRDRIATMEGACVEDEL